MRQNRGSGRLKIRADFYERKPYHYNSRLAHDAKLTTALQSVWDRALSSRAPRSLTPAAEDDTTWTRLEGEG